MWITCHCISDAVLNCSRRPNRLSTGFFWVKKKFEVLWKNKAWLIFYYHNERLFYYRSRREPTCLSSILRMLYHKDISVLLPAQQAYLQRIPGMAMSGLPATQAGCEVYVPLIQHFKFLLNPSNFNLFCFKCVSLQNDVPKQASNTHKIRSNYWNPIIK